MVSGHDFWCGSFAQIWADYNWVQFKLSHPAHLESEVMSDRKSTHQPASALMRNLKAKLPLLKRPAVWTSALLFLLPLIFLADYLNNPAKFTLDSLRPRSSEAGSEAAISGTTDLSEADGDTDPATAVSPLSDPSSLLEASTLDGSPTESDKSDSSASIFQTDLLNKLLADSSFDSAAKTAPKTTANPTASPAASSIQPSVSPISLPDDATLGLASTATASPSPGISPGVSSLQSALNRRAGVVDDTKDPLRVQLGSQLGQSNGQINGQINPQPDTRARTNAEVIQLYGQQLGQLGSFGPQIYLPATSPPAGSTGYVTPPMFRTTVYPTVGLPQTSAPSSLPNQFSNQISNPGPGSYGTSGYGISPQPNFAAPQPLVQPAPFSVPRTPPGRQIGNGQINTFSNP